MNIDEVMKQVDNILVHSGMRKTEVRRSVLQVLLESEEALSHAQIEEQFQKIDRVTLYRTLKAFEEKGVIHQAFDGTDTPKYAVCSEHCSEHQHDDDHLHFHCQICDRTFCIEDVKVTRPSLPEGYQPESAHLIVKGVCPQCR